MRKAAWAVGTMLAMSAIFPSCRAEDVRRQKADPESAALLGSPWLYTDWKVYTEADGLPHHLVFAVKADGDRVLFGTEDGAAILHRPTGKWRVLKQESEPGNNDGLAFRVVTSIDIDEDGDVWFGTFKGLTWWDGKTFRNFRMPEGQKPSDPEPKGLVNNVIYGVTHQGPDIWVATTDGTSVYNKMTDTWKTWYLNNSPMEETWCYGISSSPDKIWLAAWGAGLMEYTISKDHWNAYHDPDGSFNVDLLRNDGMLSMMSVSASYDAGAVWTASYFGVTRYDGKDFRDWDQDHGLPSNFVNFVKARGENAWIATDKGLAVYAGDKWYTYARSRGEGDTHGTLTEVGSEGKNGRVFRTASAIPHDFVWGMDFDADGGIWVTTSDGVAYGTPWGRNLAFVGQKPDPAPSEWKVKHNPGQNVLPKELTQAFYQYDREPYALPLEFPYGDFVDPVGYEKFHYEGDTVRVGFIGCLSGPVSGYSGNMLKGAQMAMEEFNEAGGYFGMPFEMVTRDDMASMGLDGHAMVELIFDEEVLGILGSMSSDTTHVGVRLSLKAEVPQMTSISTDPTITQIVIPWAYRILADDWSQGRAMAKLVFKDLGLKRLAIIERNNRYGRMGSKEIAKVAQRLGHPVEVKLKFDPADDFTPQLRIVKAYDPEAMVIWGMYANASKITKQARAMGIDALILGADGLVSEKYIELAGEDAEGVIVTFPFNDTRDTEITKAFIAKYTEKYGSPPDSFSAHGYDAMLAMGTAVLNSGKRHGRKKGLNRARIRDELSRIEKLPGATGDIEFDHTGNDMRVVEFAVIDDGKFRYLDTERLKKLRSELDAKKKEKGET